MTQINPRYTSDEESARQRAKEGKVPLPSILEIHPSPSCQLRCDYCHSLSQVENIHLRNKNLMSTNQYKKILEEFSCLGGSDLVISGGGEPLLYKEILDILQIATELNLNIHLYTNGLSKKYFSLEILDKWLINITSMRFSLHESTLRLKQFFFWSHLENTILSKQKHTLNLNLTLSLLVDTFRYPDLQLLLPKIARLDLSGIELRTLLSPTPLSKKKMLLSEKILKENRVSSNIINSRHPSSKNDRVPENCFSLYRNAVVDPFGGLRLCCTRAHLPPNDFSYVCSLLDFSFLEALEFGRKNMQSGEKKACAICSTRDRVFSQGVSLDT